MTMPAANALGAAPRPAIPSPAKAFARRGGTHFSRASPPPPDLGKDKAEGATYVLDTGVGLAFAAVNGGLGLLDQHYGSQLVYVDDVRVEWRVQSSRALRGLPSSATPEQQQDRERRKRVKAAAAVMLGEVSTRFGEAVDLGDDEVDEVDKLVSELRLLHPPKDDEGGDRGECASVRLGVKLLNAAPSGEVVVLCANDDRARRLANGHGLGHRNMHTVLREMVRARLLSAEDAYALYTQMSDLTKLPKDQRPAGADDFR